MRRFRNMLGYAINSIFRYKIRTAVVLICLLVASGMFSSVAFIKDGLTEEGKLSLKYSPDIIVQGILTGRQTPVETTMLGYIQEAPGVVEAYERIWGYGNVGNLQLVIVGVDFENLPPSQQYPIEAGTFLSPSTPNGIVIGKGVAEILGAKVGSTLVVLTESIQPRQYYVVGIFNSESNIYSADTILMSKQDARIFFDLPEEKVTDFAIYVNDLNQISYVAREISEYPNLRVVTKDVLIKAQETTYGARSGFFTVVWSIVLVCVAIVTFNQTVVVGHESKFEIGLLKSLGFSTGDIIQIRLMESAILGVLAGSLGLTAAIIYDQFLNAPILRDFMMGWAVIFPGFTLPIYISASTILFTYAVTIIPLLFATVVPAWINATVDPDIAMRGASA